VPVDGSCLPFAGGRGLGRPASPSTREPRKGGITPEPESVTIYVEGVCLQRECFEIACSVRVCSMDAPLHFSLFLSSPPSSRSLLGTPALGSAYCRCPGSVTAGNEFRPVPAGTGPCLPRGSLRLVAGQSRPQRSVAPAGVIRRGRRVTRDRTNVRPLVAKTEQAASERGSSP